MVTNRMDSGEYISTIENMDPTLSELGDEFTLGDIDGEWLCVANRVRCCSCSLRESRPVSALCDSCARCSSCPAEGAQEVCL